MSTCSRLSAIQSLPFFHHYDPLSKQLTLRGANVVPEQIFNFVDDISILDLADGSIRQLPNHFPTLKNLRVLFLSRNPLESVPEVLRDCQHLRVLGMKSCQVAEIARDALPESLEWLILTDNRLTKLPDSFDRLRKLRKCALAGNQLQSIPDSMVECQQLELLRLGANQLSNQPGEWLFRLPRLAWYCDSGNPFSPSFDYQSHLESYDRGRFQYRDQIGASPTSTVFRAIDSSTGESIAIKHYRARLTSDGFAEDDVRAYAAAGKHPQLVRARGTVHEAGSLVLVLDLVPAEFRPLAGPPDIMTCTRDTFEGGLSLPLTYISQVLRDCAAAISHLHQRGITHGDVYAHNILSDSSGRSILSDFGAASLVSGGNEEIRQRVEVRAFGYLIDDLLERWDGVGSSADLEVLKRRCLDTEVASRPLMREISNTLH